MGNQNYWKNQQELSKRAENHVKRMKELYSDEISHSIKNSIEYSGYSISSVHESAPQVVLKCSTTEALFRIKGLVLDKRVTILNFASFKNPGGKFLEGSSAQEESLCHYSTLYNVLVEKQDFYAQNKKALNKGLYMNRILYTPDILFFDEEDIVEADVITCAAPNWGAYYRNSFTGNNLKELESKNRSILSSRMEAIREIALENKTDVLILGAWGCGVFKQNPYIVSELFNEIFKNSGIFRIVYAVPDLEKYNIFYRNINQERY